LTSVLSEPLTAEVDRAISHHYFMPDIGLPASSPTVAYAKDADQD
jgi:hypothetical protein